MSIEKSKKRKCFFCGKTPKGKVVTWDEDNNYVENPDCKGKYKLILCPKCATMLGERLIGDAFTADPKVADPETALTLLKYRLHLK
jgi:MinD superfamily P-loop ATPase